MKELTAWWEETGGAERRWLLMGKGPSFARLAEFDVCDYSSVALNHVVRERPADVASAIDLDVVRDCGEAIERNARFLLMPRHPHVRCRPSRVPLESLLDGLPVLRRLSNAGRLVWYNLQSGPPAPGSPVVRCGFFSAEVVVNLLAMLGARRVRTIGVDGGTSYAGQFGDLANRTRLANGQSTFDRQFRGIARAIHRHNLDYAPLTSEAPARVFIGTDESQLLGARVLEYSIRQSATISVVCDTMQQVRAPLPRDPKNQPRTQFSFNRFAIPALAGYRGRAVYVDADMQVFRDFREIWDLPFSGATVLHAPSADPRRPKQFSVLLLDCERLRWNLPEIVRGLDAGSYDYDALVKEMCLEPEHAVRPGLPPEWNSLERYRRGRTGLLHYTDMRRQPWVSRHNPRGSLWVRALRDAVREGYIPAEDVDEAVRRGFVRPSLLWELRLPAPLWSSFNHTVGPALDLRFRAHRVLRARLGNARPARV